TNTTSNCNLTSFQLYNSVYLLELTLYILIFFFGAIFNALALWVFFCKVKKWTETRVYIVNLVFADCSVICSLPLVIYLRWNKSGRDELCQAAEAVYFINMEVSIYITLFISLDRYVAIRHPLAARALRSPGKAALLCALPWLAATAAAALRLKGRQATGCFQRDTARPPPLSLLSLFFVFT
ncbi:GPR35 protein, partial [Eudromia elegans]|nr:GPR35 protein [Eudromia elegans]